MPLLVDGHNLIAQIPGLSLADADDEAQLVLLLRSYAMAKRGRQVVVVFDHGVYGHPQQLNGYGVTCYFARSPSDADNEIVRRLGLIARPKEWTLVSSDRAVKQVAMDCGVRVMSSQKFAAQLTTTKSGAPPQEKPADVQLSEAEVEEWLQLFNEQGPEEPPPRAPQPATRSAGRKRRRKS